MKTPYVDTVSVPDEIVRAAYEATLWQHPSARPWDDLLVEEGRWLRLYADMASFSEGDAQTILNCAWHTAMVLNREGDTQRFECVLSTEYRDDHGGLWANLTQSVRRRSGESEDVIAARPTTSQEIFVNTVRIEMQRLFKR